MASSLKYAHSMDDIFNAFDPRPLKTEDMREFYCETMPVRTGDEDKSPIEDIVDACTRPVEHCACLLLGHTGCGKSTELNRMSDQLWRMGYPAFTVQCGQDLNLLNLVYEDLMILMGDALLSISGAIGFTPSEKVRNAIEGFWAAGEKTVSIEDERRIEAEAGITANTPPAIAKLLKLFLSVKSDLKLSAETRTVYQQKIQNRSSEWMSMLNQFTSEISEKLGGKWPVMIFEDLDKLDPQRAWDVFYSHASTLSNVPFPVIYTYPIAAFYGKSFKSLRDYFDVERLPMIKQETVDGKPYPDGYRTLEAIVERRADLSLFDADALKLLIEKTGGSLRDLFKCIVVASRRAQRSYRRGARKEERINREDARSALEDLRSDLTATIEEEDYDFLLNIIAGNRTRIQKSEKLLEMLQAGVVLEYNGARWHNVHPLVADFLAEQT